MEQEEDGLNLRRYLDIFLRWWWIIVLVPLVLGGAVYFFSRAQTKIYQADVTILVQQSQSPTPTLGDIQTSQLLANTYQRLVTTRPILEQVAIELALFDLAGNPDIGVLKGSVGASTVRDTQLLKIEARSSDRVLAADIANTLARVFRDETQIRLLSEIARLQALAAQQGVVGSERLLEAQMSVLGGLSIIEPAVVPGSPVSPRVSRNTAIGIALGVLLGIIAAFLLETLGNRVRSADQVENLFEESERSPSNIGVVYRWPNKDVSSSGLVVQHNPESIFAEMFRQVRTGLNFVIAPTGGKVFLITSVAPSEGKSTVISNLGVALAQGGSKVIIVESEMRRPTLHRMFDLARNQGSSRATGLSDFLANSHDDVLSLLKDTGTQNLRILTSGTIPPNPADLLSSPRMMEVIETLKRECDVMLLDSPPVLAAADSVILASMVDGIVFVVAMGEARPDTFRDAAQQIGRAGTPILGYILNKVKARRFGYGDKYGYYHYYRSRQDDGSGSPGKERQPETIKEPTEVGQAGEVSRMPVDGK